MATGMRKALQEILDMAINHPAFDGELFQLQDLQTLADVGGDVYDWTMVAIIAQNALTGRKLR
jgi:hypothetical protein